MSVTIGFVGQGWIGRNYADSFEERGFSVVRYAKEPEYIGNKEKLAECDVVFIAVPTPTTEHGFDDSTVREAVGLVPKGSIAVIKSTIVPGTARSIQSEYPGTTVLFVPEFLREATVRFDIDNPDKNIVATDQSERGQEAASLLLDILPHAPYRRVCSYEEAELTKYGINTFLYAKVVFMNLLYDLAKIHGVSWEELKENLVADPRIGTSHMQPVHQIAHLHNGSPGEDAIVEARGAGGHCFIKDFAAFEEHYTKMVNDPHGHEVLNALRVKNIQLLRNSKKDIAFLKGVYGEDIETQD
jgi:hypothetical protein